MRVPLPDGEWADLVDRLNHAQLRRIRRAAEDDEQDSLTEGAAALLTGWLLRDVAGVLVPFPALSVDGVPSETLDTLPADVVLVIARAALEIAKGATSSLSPKGSAGRSPGSSPASGSARTRTWRTSGSSRPIPAGPGPISSQPLPT